MKDGVPREGSIVTDNHEHDDTDVEIVALVAKVLEHALRMAGKHGIAIAEADLDKVVKAILEKEDCSNYEADLSQAVISMLQLPAALGAYNQPLDFILANEVVAQIDMQRADAQVADRRATLHVLRKPSPDKPKR
jgi:hypothetical protein